MRIARSRLRCVLQKWHGQSWGGVDAGHMKQSVGGGYAW